MSDLARDSFPLLVNFGGGIGWSIWVCFDIFLFYLKLNSKFSKKNYQESKNKQN